MRGGIGGRVGTGRPHPKRDVTHPQPAEGDRAQEAPEKPERDQGQEHDQSDVVLRLPP